MSQKVYAKLVVGIPIPGTDKKRWRQVGAVLKYDGEDTTKGPGLSIMLDKDFNPAGVDNNRNPHSVALQMFWPDEDKTQDQRNRVDRPRRDDDFDDDIPF